MRRRQRTLTFKQAHGGGIMYAVLAFVAMYFFIRYEKWVLVAICASLAGWGIYSYRQHLQAVARQRMYEDQLRRSGIAGIDRFSGERFEERLCLLFRDRGWKVDMTAGSGDFGADLIGTNAEGHRVVIQAKRWQETVGIGAVQEVLGAQRHYHAAHMMVITNSHLSAQARVLAEDAGVEVWERERLIQELALNPLEEAVVVERDEDSYSDRVPLPEPPPEVFS